MLQLNQKTLIKLLKISLILAAVALLVYFLPSLLTMFAPFVAAFIIASISAPMIKVLEKRLRLPRRLAGMIMVVLAVGLVLGIITAIVARLIVELNTFIQTLPSIYGTASAYMKGMMVKWDEYYLSLPDNVVTFIDSFIDQSGQSLMQMVTSFVEPVTKGTLNIAMNFPQILLFTITLIISTYFVMCDRELINNFFSRLIPDRIKERVKIVRDDMLSALFGYLRAQLILMSITFVELSIGFSLIGIQFALIFALIISLIDALPILGTGTVLIPWAIVCIISGDYIFGLYLIVIYGICLTVRQLLEPKVLSAQIGVHPLVTLIAMYVGLRCWGFVGMIFGPISAVILINMHKSGLFKALLED